eukprot:gnl/TRDRNA2_/TRDRNA2_134926_c0_seq2.p1 gnl/TRDRNA2_/TRDRNA2_134926_c0~~gnl/TRDRNA2_/TRDRNA2_134926_c0_seq2.p1  ORF type:complete len:318 (-),score=39.31 gnl/TRDRNA2_/TRDRNA2_134926_c0_seq2:140-1093(-)
MVRRLCTCSVLLVSIAVGVVAWIVAVGRSGGNVPPHFLLSVPAHQSRTPEFFAWRDSSLDVVRRKKVCDYTLGHEVVNNAEWLASGLVLDFGVWVGGSTRFVAQLLKNHTTVHGFDSFDWSRGTSFMDYMNFLLGAHVARENNITFIDGIPSSNGLNVVFHRGMIADTGPQFLAEVPGQNITLMHIDTSGYETTSEILEMCRMQLVPGSILVFDDWMMSVSFEMEAFFDFHRKYDFEYEFTSWGDEIMSRNVNGLMSYLNQFYIHMWLVPHNREGLAKGLFHAASWSEYWFIASRMVQLKFPYAIAMRVMTVGKLHS